MPIDSDTRNRAEALLGSILLVVAIGGGWYLVDDSVTGDLRFVEVGWWNIRDLSSASRDDGEIADIAACIEGLHVLAVGELNDRAVLGRITDELGPSWRWDATESKIGRTSSSKEYYGFLWDSSVVDMVGDIQVDPDPGDHIDREPAWATFRTTDGNLDFTVIAVHITWGSNVPARKAEIRSLDEVWVRTQTATLEDDDLILVGDFNRNIGDDSFDEVLGLDGMVRANGDTIPTHISSHSTYDQVFISLDATSEWTGEYGIFAFDEEFFNDDDQAANLAVSDHRPVWITLFVPDRDDD